MAEFLITAPDGKQYKVTGATREGALAALKKKLGTAPATPVNPDGTGVGRAIQRGAVQTAAALPTALATADLRALTDVNRSPEAIRYDEALRAGVPNQAFASRASDMSDPQQVNSMMQQYGVSPQANVNYQQVVEKRLENREDAAQNPAEYLKRLSANSETAGRLFKLADSFERSPTADAYAQSLAEAPDSFMGWLGTVTDDPLGFMAFMGETIAESAPQIAAGAATTAVTGNPVAGASVMSLGGLGREYANEVNSFLSENGIDLSDPEAAKKLFANKDLMDKANERGLTRGLVIAAADFAGQGLVSQQIIRKSLKRQAVAQGGSEASGEALATKAVGDEFSAKDTIIEGLAGTGSTVGEATVSRTLFNKDGEINNPDNLDPESAQAAGDFARRLREIANANNYNLGDVNAGSTKGARETVDKAHIQYTEELKQLFKDLGERVKPNDLTTFVELKDKIMAQAAYREARNKTKSTVGQQELDAMRRLVGDTAEGQQAINLMLQLNQLTELHNEGYKGGVSRFTDVFNPIDQNINSYDGASRVVTGTLSPLATVYAGAATGGASLAPQAALFGTGRAIDKMTGRRSTVDRFVRRNEGNLPSLPTPDAPSLRDARIAEAAAATAAQAEADTQAAARAEAQRKLNLELVQKNAPPQPDSPQGIIESSTGLDRSGVAKVLRVLSASNSNPALQNAIESYRKSIATGGKVDDLTPLIRAVKQFVRDNPEFVRPVREPVDNYLEQPGEAPAQPNVNTTEANPIQAQTFGPQLTTPENYNRGIEANIAANRELVEGVVTDPQLNRVQKGRLITALDNLNANLGSDPVAAAQEQVQKLEDAGVPQEAIDTYIQPYVDRVARQQSRPRENTSILNEMMADNPKKPQAPRLAPEQIPTETRKVYKLMKVQKSRPGEVLPLFAKSGGDKGPASGYTLGEWFGAENQRPKLGNKLLAPRPGIHAVNLPVFDQGKAKVKGEQRVWVEVEIPAVSAETQAESDNSPVLSNGMRTGVQDRLIAPNESYDYKTNPNASNDAGGWPVAGSMKALRIVPDAEIEQILRDNGLDHQVENSFSDVDEAKAQELMRQATPIEDAMAPREQSALNMFKDPLSIDGKPTVKKIGEAMTQDHMDNVGRQLFPETSEDDYQTVFDYAAEEMLEQLKQPNSGVGWYSADVEEAMRLASKVYPTLATDPTHRQLYLTFAGIFSNGSDPDNAFMMSSWAFEDFLRTGQIPVNRAEGFYQQGLEPPKTTFKSTKTGKMVTKDAGWGIRNQANEQQLGMLRYLVETRGGLQSAMDFLLTPQSREDINNVMLDSGLYKAGRYTTKKDKAGPDEYGFLAFGKKLGRYSLGLHGVDIDAGDTTIDLWYTRTFRRWTGRLLETPIGKEGVAAQPANDAERDVIFRLTGELAEKFGLPPGDVQAVLWFFEKRTWGSQGLNTKEGTNSSGARKLLREKGIDPDDGAGSNAASPQPSPETEQSRGNIGVAGALANAIQGTNPGSSSGNTIPSDAEVKQQYAPTRAAFQVGKKGTDTENGIKDVDGVNRLAEAIGVHVKAYGAQRRMSKEMNPGGAMNPGLTGLFFPKTNTAAYLKPGVKRADGSIVSENESFITALHELAHGIAEKNPDGSVSPHSTRMANSLTDSSNAVRVGSFEHVIGEILERPLKERNAIRDEIIKLQDKMHYTFADGSTQPTRDLVEVEKTYEQLAPTRDAAFRRKWAPIIRNHRKYVRNVYEMAVDPLIWYLFDPKAFKKEAPKTAKLIRDYFNEAGKIQFYSHPLAMGVAVVLAMLMKADQEDEQKKQMPPGALNQPMPMGALSQA